MSQLKSPSELNQLRTELIKQRETKPISLAICSGTGCLAAKSGNCAGALAAELAKQGLDEKVELRLTGCYGFCERGPIVVIQPENTCYLKVQTKDAPEIVAALKKGEVVERLLYQDDDGHPIRALDDIPFYQKQKRVLLHSNTLIDPQEIEDYIAIGGYSALAKVLYEMQPDQIVDWIKQSGLRGRGGGGFPAGIKWETTRKAKGDIKYVIVNGDEGDPGAYMDRSLLEGNPHSILEGLIIGAYAIGAAQGYIYVRQEYPLAIDNVSVALEQARDYGLLGKNILGSGFDFDVTIHRGAGAFVSGESSALMSAIEGRVGQPRPKYIHTSVSGLWERPTNLNNVETWANVPLIIQQGVDWYRSMGTKGSPGTKVFSLVGKVNNTGLVEVPMGITLREIIFDIGGGIPNGKHFKAVQTGGPSGGFLPESQLDLPVDFDELWKAGSMMGSGGMIVMDEDSCMVDATHFYVKFLAHESCGQCIPCREGLRQMLRILDNIVNGKGREGDLELLEELCELMQDASLCALGTSAPYPVLSALKHFRNEFVAHIEKQCCPALVCRELIHFQIEADRCDGCHLCTTECPTRAIVGAPKSTHTIDQEKCIKCGNCLQACSAKHQAIVKAAGAAQIV
jgi:NADH-quinone oxidoreductase subunit F